MSSRGLADAALQQAVKPWSSISLAWRAVSRVCSSGGMLPSESRLGVLAKLMWAWASISPGISVAPPPSIMSALPALPLKGPSITSAMRLPRTRTAPANGLAPVASSTLTL